MLEVKKTAAADPSAAWPGSLYARPRLPFVPALGDAPIVPEAILEGCRLAVQQLGVEGITSLGVTSAMRGEGRTTIALATALVLAEYGIDTALVEMDLGNPQLGHRLQVAKYPGVVDLADGRVSLQDVMRPISQGLSLIPAGQLHGSAPRVLSEFARAEILNHIADAGHVVVADLPPLLRSSTGHQAANLMAELLLVVRAGVVSARNITDAVSGLTVPPKVLLNGTHSRVPSWALRLAGI